MTELYGQSVGKDTEEAKTSNCSESPHAREAIRRVFSLQESALLWKGAIKTRYRLAVLTAPLQTRPGISILSRLPLHVVDYQNGSGSFFQL